MKIFLSLIEDVFQINQRGCVVIPGIPRSINLPIKIGAAIRLIRPDGSEADSTICGIELGGHLDAPSIPILLGTGISKDQIPIGTQLWLDATEIGG